MINLKKLRTRAAAFAGTAVIAASAVSYTPASADSNPNYAEALALSLYFFDANECGSGVDDNALTWRGNCHTYDAQASLSSATYLGSSEKQKIQAQTGGDTVDVSGGYHDAGDHVKFNLTMGYAASCLGLSYYMNPGAYEKAGCEAHLKEILKKTTDYLKKTTFLDDSGNVYAVCATVSNQSDHSYWTAPETQNYNRPTYWLTASRNNSVITSWMSGAFSAAAYVFKDSDPTYSAECKKYAKALFNFGKDHPGMEDVNDGMYTTTDTYIDNLMLAQVMMYINGDADLPDCKPNGDKSYTYNGQKYYDYYLYCWDKAWSGYAAVMYRITGDKTYAEEAKREVEGQGGLPTSSYNGNGWGAARYNCALQFCGQATEDPQLMQGAKFQMDHILGNNSRGYSYLLGFGDKWPTHIHHRAANPGNGNQTSTDNPDSKYVLYGALVGGDDASGAYEDHSDRYQFTEPALDYNGSFALAIAPLVNQYGGDADEIKTLIASAPEINENYDFGGGEVIVPPTPQPQVLNYKYDINQDAVINVSDIVCLERFLTKQYKEVNEVYDIDNPPAPGSVTHYYQIGDWKIPIGQTATGYSYQYGGISNFDVTDDDKANVFDLIALKRYIDSLSGHETEVTEYVPVTD